MLKPTSDRDKKGLFVAGNKVSHTVYQRQADRIKSIEEMFTGEEIFAIANDPKKLRARSARDAQIIMQLAKSMQWPADLTNADVRAERETLLDRLEGKANQSVDIKANIETTHLHGILPEQLEILAKAILNNKKSEVIDNGDA